MNGRIGGNDYRFHKEFDYAIKNKAKVDSLDYYFKNNFVDVNNVHNIEFLDESKIKEDKSWIDWSCVSETSEGTEKYKKHKKALSKSEYTTNPPLRCTKCDMAFTPYKSSIHNNQKTRRKSIYLPKTVFNKVRLEKSDCGMCDE
jgi:hypothetical protein